MVGTGCSSISVPEECVSGRLLRSLRGIRQSFLDDRHHIFRRRGFHRLVEVGEHHDSLSRLVIDRPHRKAKCIVMKNLPTCNRNEGNPGGQSARRTLPSAGPLFVPTLGTHTRMRMATKNSKRRKDRGLSATSTRPLKGSLAQLVDSHAPGWQVSGPLFLRLFEFFAAILFAAGGWKPGFPTTLRPDGNHTARLALGGPDNSISGLPLCVGIRGALTINLWGIDRN